MTGQLVRDLMQQNLVACLPSTPLEKIEQTMNDRSIDSVIVVDNLGNLEGTLNSTDLVRARLMNGHSNGNGNGAGKPLHAMNKLVDNGINRLVVVQQENGHKKPVGILSATDLAHVTA